MTESLIIAPNWVGDTVMSLPFIEALAASDRSVTLLAKAHLRPLLELGAADVAVLVRSESDAETVENLRRPEFNEAVVLPNSLRSAMLAYRARIGCRWGYRSSSLEGIARALLLGPTVRQPDRRSRHQVEDYAELLAAMGVEPPGSWTPRLTLSAGARADGRALLERAGTARERGPVIGLFAGAEFGASKRWPWRRFAELARNLRRARADSRLVFVAGPKELWLAVRMHEETGKIHPVIGPDLDLGRLAHVLAHLDLLVTNDSGPMHLAAALGVPCLALFGPTDPRRTSPVGEGHRIEYSDRWCSPCFRRRCPLIHHGCMRDLTVDRISGQALAMLEAGKRID